MTDETKQPWTEGPWELGEENCGGGSNVRAVVAESAEGAVVGWTARVVIAGDEVVSDAEANANAKIMAAAPAMAEALAELVTAFEGTQQAPDDGSSVRWVRLIRSAEKARDVLDAAGWQWGGR